jgi:hypothetical protein
MGSLKSILSKGCIHTYLDPQALRAAVSESPPVLTDICGFNR